MFCNLQQDAVITARDVETTYEVPLVFHEEGLDQKILDSLKMWTKKADLSQWKEIVNKIKHPQAETTIAVVGKYMDLADSYKSLHAALIHAGIANDARVKIRNIDSEEIEKSGIGKHLDGVSGILVPGGFGSRGIEGKIKVIQHARENKIPFFGICLGMQMAVIEYARNVMGIKNATSLEIDENAKEPVINLMEDQKKISKKGATMRLGSYLCNLQKETAASKAYGRDQISERHRHRYEFNNQYMSKMAEAGMVFSGICPENQLVEIVEIKDHPWFLGCQYHPEFQSKPMKAHPLFKAFVKASLANR
ncbi:MAG: CTP synthase [Bdellovibrionota bacterium]